MASNPLLSASFWALDTAAKANVRAYVDPQGTRLKFNLKDVYFQRSMLAIVVNDAEDRLEKINVASFAFLSAAQKDALEGDLFLIFYQLSAQYQLDAVEREGHLLSARAEQLKHCAALLNRLRLSRVCQEDTSLMCEQSVSEKHTKYLGLRLIVPELLEHIDAIHSGRVESARQWMSFVNERRLYWVWGGGMIATLLAALPQYLAGLSTANSILGTISPITGSMSWLLYFARAGIVWSGLLAHTFEIFMSKEERDLGIPWHKRFQTQWGIRKYALLNDTIWGICNMACFFVLVGSGMAGYWGNAFTALLLLMDASLTVWRMAEEETEHNANMMRYQEDMDVLKKKIKIAERSSTKTDDDGVALENLREALFQVKLKAHRARLNWKYKQLNTAVDLVYAVSLLSAFCILCCFFFPPTAVLPATALIFSIIGISMCFVFNLIYMSTTMSLSVSKSKEIRQATEDAFDERLDDFTRLACEYAAIPTDDDVLHVEHRKRLMSQLKQHYLTLKELRTDVNYQKASISHQRYQVIYSTVRDALIPPLFIATLVFMPMGIGIPILVAGLALAAGAYLLLAHYEPQKSKLAIFHKDEFEQCYQKALHKPDAIRDFLDASIKAMPSTPTAGVPHQKDEASFATHRASMFYQGTTQKCLPYDEATSPLLPQQKL
jgi:hypothetical protein